MNPRPRPVPGPTIVPGSGSGTSTMAPALCGFRPRLLCIFMVACGISIGLLVGYFEMEKHWWKRRRACLALEASPVFWTAHPDGTREALANRKPAAMSCGAGGSIHGSTLEELAHEPLPMLPWACACDGVEFTGAILILTLTPFILHILFN